MNSRLKRRLISEWVGMPHPADLPSTPSDLRAIFHKAFSRLGIGARFQESALQENWQEVVGPTLASHCHPKGVRQGMLSIFVDHPAWLHQITFAHKTDILRAVQDRFPHLKIRDLQLRIG